MFLFATLNFFVCMSHFFYYSYNVNPQERAKRLEEKMHAQFNKMHDFLRKKEEEMVRQLQRQASSAEVSMKQNASFFSKLQINGNNQESILESGLQISQPERFLEVISLQIQIPVPCLNYNLSQIAW